MSLTTQILSIVASLLSLGFVLENLRRRRLRERHAAWWLVAGAAALIVSIFPGILVGLADAIGIALPVNLVFFVSLIVLFLVCIQQSVELTHVETKTRTLAEQVALLDLRITQLEGRRDQRPRYDR